MNKDAEALARLREALASLGPDLLEELEKVRDVMVREPREEPAHRLFEHVRSCYNFTQEELARKSGVTQSQISRVEGGFDALLSTWTRVYAAMGYDVLLLPVPRGSIDELRKRAAEDRPPGHSLKMRARPRRRWKEYYAKRRAEKGN